MAIDTAKYIIKLERRLAMYSDAVNQIDDYFEYAYMGSDSVKHYMYSILTKLAANVRTTVDPEFIEGAAGYSSIAKVGGKNGNTDQDDHGLL